ncbi:MAG: efflux RND transporter periplasmic adaptor subunit [Calditrichia bacterium]
MSKKKVILFAIGLIVITVVVLAALRSGDKEKALAVNTEKVKRQVIVETVTATGRIQPKTQVKISADVGAKIVELAVKEGDWVEKGQLLCRLDQERFKAAVESAEANLRSYEANARLAKQNLVKAEKDYQRTLELFEKQLESQAVLDQVYAAFQVEKARYQSALEQVDQARAALKQARDDLSKTTIYAPMSGTISQLNKEVGEIALGSQFQEDVIMVVSNLSGMEALVDVDENDIVRVSVGDSARVEVDAFPEQVFHGVVSEIASSAKISGSGTTEQKTDFEVKIAILDAGGKLRPGMTSSAEIITETHQNALAIPIQSVAVRTMEQLKKDNPKTVGDQAIADSTPEQEYKPDKDGFVPVVFVVNNGRVFARQVKTGIQSETHIEILEGLEEGDEIVVGSYRALSQDLQNGSMVKVSNGKTEE